MLQAFITGVATERSIKKIYRAALAAPNFIKPHMATGLSRKLHWAMVANV
jgi:hypothetical protein